MNFKNGLLLNFKTELYEGCDTRVFNHAAKGSFISFVS